MKKHIIIAPHADDEIIGCFQILDMREVALVVFPEYNEDALLEVQVSKNSFKFKVNSFSSFKNLMAFANVAKELAGFIFFPDPVYETHPDHRIIGAFGERLVKEKHYDNVVFYTTNMNAPYMQEVLSSSKKEIALSSCYPDKESLWKYDHKYFLFEGYCRYGLPI